MSRIRALVPSTDNGRAIVAGLIGLTVGFVLSPWPWLGAVIPSSLLIILGVFTPAPEEPDR